MSFEDLTEEQKASLKGDKGEQGIQGPKGDQGEPGPAGKDGTNGIDGKDGADYVLTDADKTEIAQLALAAMPVAEEGAY
jgi:hypothetical protein